MSVPRLRGRRLVLGVCGSIAAYKAISLLRLLKAEGAEVRVVLTPAATKFVAPLTFETLSHHAVATDLFALHDEMVHLAWAEWAEAVVLAPCTANRLATSALGLANDLLSTLLLATRGRTLYCPAMDGGMWDHPAVQANVDTLRARGCTVLEPEIGPLASGRVGRGRLPDETTILQTLLTLLEPTRDLAGARVLISAGPTREAIDPVRFLSNHSSGKMGFALAQVAQQRGAEVVLVSGPTALDPPPGVEVVSVVSAEDMYKALSSRLSWATLVIMAAAVADYRPTRVHAHKVKKSAGLLANLSLEPTPDILSSLSRLRTTQCMVGFAAETDNLLGHARAKLAAKGLDLIVANNVLTPGAGFGSDTNQVTMIDRNGQVTELPLLSKREVAHHILDTARALMADTSSSC